MNLNGILNIYKEKGYTSHDVVAVARKILNQKKIGHTGTLDPEAEGVLPICIGKATKAVEYITDQKKIYRAVVKLGTTTTTEDHTGDIITKKPVIFNEEDIRQAVDTFVGEHEQIPPMYSAIKVNGKKLYELARQGKTIERKPRKITIYNIDIHAFMPPDQIQIDVKCSKGTYIRTLCADIGEKLGFGAHMNGLIRTEVGIFNIQNSIKLGDLKELVLKGKVDGAMVKVEKLFDTYPKIKIQSTGEKALKNGNKLHISYAMEKIEKINSSEIFKVYDFSNQFVGLYKIKAEGTEYYLKPLKLFL
ncbi:MAG: tRNA pseudouridine(55) synthase TruB [Epulopiscium sp.]|nr:tRNA pseudouridine(55) synthase TruB [Candidatus Epulonipiscium sp.]